MRRAEAKIVENRKEDPASEPDQDPNTWLIEAKLDENILDWESVRLDFRFSEIDAEILESSMSEANRFTVRTRGKSPLQKDITGKTVLQRSGRLEQIINPVPGIQVGGYVENRGIDLYRLAKEKGHEGIIAKDQHFTALESDHRIG